MELLLLGRRVKSAPGSLRQTLKSCRSVAPQVRYQATFSAPPEPPQAPAAEPVAASDWTPVLPVPERRALTKVCPTARGTNWRRSVKAPKPQPPTAT